MLLLFVNQTISQVSKLEKRKKHSLSRLSPSPHIKPLLSHTSQSKNEINTKEKMFSRFEVRVCLTVIVALLATTSTTHGYTAMPSGRGGSRSSSAPSSPQNQPMTAQNMLKTVVSEQERGNNWKLSHSVLASCDTLPQFPTAHGILSPETVSRMDELTAGGNGNEAVATFLENYRRNGPMSCLPMLSDPEVLPHLTNAMREIV